MRRILDCFCGARPAATGYLTVRATLVEAPMCRTHADQYNRLVWVGATPDEKKAAIRAVGQEWALLAFAESVRRRV